MITPQQREARKKFIGSSDAPAIMGLDPYRSASDVWLEKTGRDSGFEGNANTERGNYLEPALLDYAVGQIGTHFIRGLMKTHSGGVLAANFDGICTDDSFIVEAKTSNNPDDFGEQMTDQIPERHIIQVHHAMYVAGPQCRKAFVPVLLPGYRSLDFRMYIVNRDDDLAEMIAARGIQFFEVHVRMDLQPADFKPSLEVLKRMKRTPGKVVSVAADLVDRVTVLRAAANQAEKDKKAAEAELLATMGDADGADTDRATITYLETKRAGYTVQPTAFRTLKIKAKKEISYDDDGKPAARTAALSAQASGG